MQTQASLVGAGLKKTWHHRPGLYLCDAMRTVYFLMRTSKRTEFDDHSVGIVKS
jgi:hypothetical protein